MVVVHVGVEDAADLVHRDAEGVQGVEDPRAGVDEVEPALVAEEAGHARSPRVPAVSLAGVHHGEELPSEAAGFEPVGRLVVLAGPQVQVDLDGFAPGDESIAVQPPAFEQHPGTDFERPAAHDAQVEQFPRVEDPVEGEPELPAQHLAGPLFRQACRPQLLPAGETVVAPKDVGGLGADLVFEADEHWPSAVVVGVAGQDHPLPVQHLQDGKLGKIREAAALYRQVREQDRVGTGFEAHSRALGRGDQTLKQEVFHRVRRASAENPKINCRLLHPPDAIGHPECTHTASHPPAARVSGGGKSLSSNPPAKGED